MSTPSMLTRGLRSIGNLVDTTFTNTKLNLVMLFNAGERLIMRKRSILKQKSRCLCRRTSCARRSARDRLLQHAGHEKQTTGVLWLPKARC